MKVIFAQNMFHVPSHGGANKANRLLAEALAAQGHECHVVAPTTGALPHGTTAELTAYLEAAGAVPRASDGAALEYELAGVRVHGVLSPSRLVKRLRSVVADVDPDWIVVPSDDPGSMLLAAALAIAPDRVVYLGYTIQQFPCGPAAFRQSPTATAMLRRAAGVLTISEAARDYLRQWAEVDSEIIYPPVYGPLPAPTSARWDAGSVTMVNPSEYKGIRIFLDLARAFPDVPFTAVPTWATTPDDRQALATCPNIKVIEPADDIDSVLGGARILLVPSLWDETFGFICVDAMLRGVPVLASAVGGLPEAKLGVEYVLPVRRVERYDGVADPARPVPQVPEQDIAPWCTALRRLLEDRAHFDDVAARSCAAARSFVGGIDGEFLAGYLRRLARGADRSTAPGTRRREGEPMPLRIPRLNANDETYVLVEWLADKGSLVSAGTVVATIETAKASADLVAERDGALYPIVDAGAECEVGQVVANLIPAGNSDSPVAADAKANGGAPAVPALPDSPAGARTRDESRLRARAQDAVAEVVTRSHATIPAAFCVVKVRVDGAMAHAKAMTRRLRALVGLPELVIEAMGGLLPTCPRCFAVPEREGRDGRPQANVGVSIDVGTGLYAPVIPAVDGLSLREISTAMLGFRRTAMRGGFRAEQLSGATIMLTLSTDEIMFSRPIVFPGQYCAVSLGSTMPALRLDPVTGAVTTERVVHIGLSYDHRVLNGSDAARFLAALKARLEAWGEADAELD